MTRFEENQIYHCFDKLRDNAEIQDMSYWLKKQGVGNHGTLFIIGPEIPCSPCNN